METTTILNDLRIASPCQASWDKMKGNDRVRFCDLCSRHVYSISNLTTTEASDLIQQAEGRRHLCVRLYRRKDGTVLTGDCPVGLRYALRRRLIRLATSGVLLAVAVRSGVWVYALGADRPDLPPAPSGPNVTYTDWADWAAMAIGLKDTPSPRCGTLMGDVY
jgi:hypothetical protein